MGKEKEEKEERIPTPTKNVLRKTAKVIFKRVILSFSGECLIELMEFMCKLSGAVTFFNAVIFDCHINLSKII